jgi:hypothetical protein
MDGFVVAGVGVRAQAHAADGKAGLDAVLAVELVRRREAFSANAEEEGAGKEVSEVHTN